MKIDLQQDFPAKIDRLWATFANTEYPEQKYRALGATGFEMLSFKADEQSIEIDLQRTFPVRQEHIPSWARPFFTDAHQTLRHRTQWRRLGSALIEAQLAIDPLGMPVGALGRGRIVESSAGTTTMTLEFDVESSLPLLGGKIARFFAEQIKNALSADHAFTLDYLERHRR